MKTSEEPRGTVPTTNSSSSRLPPQHQGSGIPMPIASSSGGAKARTANRTTATTTAAAAKKKIFASAAPHKQQLSHKSSSSAGEAVGVQRVPGVTVKRKLSIGARSKTCSLLTSKRERPDPEVASRKAPAAAPSVAAASSRHKFHDKRRPMFGKKNAGSRTDEQDERENVVGHHHHRGQCSSSSSEVSQLEREKDELLQRVSDLVHNAEVKKAEVIALKVEMGKLKELQKSRSETVLLEVESLYAENRLLRDRLEELGFPLAHTALSDTEKELLLSKKCNSAPPSIVGVPTAAAYRGGEFAADADCDGGETAASERGSLEWDKQSSSSVSEMSVACLQDRIMQMEETHYSTSEELQATLQELSDLQDQLTELQSDNERLTDEKAMFLESLCAKVQQLEESRSQVDSLRQLLLQQHDDSGGSASEREQKLLELLKCCQDEKVALLLKQDELSQELVAGKEQVLDALAQAANAVDRTRLLESRLDGAHADQRLLERQLAECREQLSGEAIEANRVRMLLDTERAKVAELQQARQARDRSELDELLDLARKEKDRLEGKATSLQEQLALSQCEAARLREQLGAAHDDARLAKNNARELLAELEYRLQHALAAKDDADGQLLGLQEAVRELERKCQRHLEDKRELRATISELQKKLNEASGRAESVQRHLDELSQKHDKETEEWKQFQSDLLMTVRVANDFKTEAQQDVENLMAEMRHLLERLQSLEAENERLRAMKTTTSPTFHRRQQQPPSDDVVLSVEQELGVCLRPQRPPPGGRPDARQSVKSLIESIENASKQTKAAAAAAAGSGSPTSSSPKTSPASGATSPTLVAPMLKRPDSSDLFIRPPSGGGLLLRDPKAHHQLATGTVQPLRQRNSYTEGMGQRSPTSCATAAGLPNNKGGGGSEKNNQTSPQSSASRGDPADPPAAPPPVFKPAAIVSPTPVSILTNKTDAVKRASYGDSPDKKDPLTTLARGGGSRRNALLKWCQNKTVGYRGIDITNFSSSWNDGLALCALLHTYLPDVVPYDSLDNKDKRRNFALAFQAAESVGIPTLLNINDMISMERPDWQSVMTYVTSIYKHFET